MNIKGIIFVVIFFINFSLSADELDMSVLNKKIKQFSNENISFNVSGNYRFAFACAYPNYLNPVSRSGNGDGVSIANKNGSVTLTCSGAPMLEETLSEGYAESIRSLENKEGFEITYKVIKENWYVISGINRAKNNIFYFKVLKDKDWVTGYNELKFNLEYPLDDKNKLLPGQVKLFTNN